VAGTPSYGSLTVNLAPAAAGGQWRLQGDTNWQSSGFTYSNLNSGNQIVEFKSVSGYDTPATRQVYVADSQVNTISATYLVDIPSGATIPSLLQFSDVSQPLAGQPPYPWCGQLLTDSGYGSGCVVKPRVVLTAAHVVFNDASLSFVTGVNWFFQRYQSPGTADDYEPPAQVPRGWYVFSGYATARTNDNSPGVSSPVSQNQDVAALYFMADAGRGGYSGYLVSNPNGTEWLQAGAQKTLIGYPVDGAAGLFPGRMYGTIPGTRNFAQVTNQVFSTTDILGYPGMSGGPLCVLYSNATYFPAGIFLGGSGGATIVRAIDGAVADLINRAEETAYTSDNNTGGGVILLTSSTGGLFATGNFQVMITPAAAITAGAGWRVTTDTNNPGTYYSDSNATYSLPAENYTLTFHAASGYVTPPNRPLAVVASQTGALVVTYTSTNIVPYALPIGMSNGVVQLSFSAPTGQRYAIERSTNLTAWVTLGTNTVGADGVLRVGDSNLTNNLQRAFYRARFAP